MKEVDTRAMFIVRYPSGKDKKAGRDFIPD